VKKSMGVVAAAIVAAASGQAMGQTALGDGRGLERDLSGRGIGNVPRADFMSEVRRRNDMVTGNAAGGRSFRGNVGYRSSDEFRGSLGSDDLFSFRRDSLGSGAAGTGFRGTSGLQYQYSYSTANDFGSTLSRSGGATNASKVQPMVSSAVTPRRVSTDTFSGLGDGWNTIAPKLNSLRSTTSFNSTSSFNPSLMGQRNGPEGPEWVTSSSLLGIRSAPARRSDTPDNAVNKPVGGERLNQSAGPEIKTGFEESNRPGEKNSDTVRTSYSQVVERMEANTKDRAAAAQPATETKEGEKPAGSNTGAEPGTDASTPLWESRLQKLREQMDEAKASYKAPDAKSQIRRRAELAAMSGEKAGDTGAKPVSASDNQFVIFDEATLEMIRLSGGEVGTYTLNTAEKDLYSRYMTDGSAALARGRYFDAEEQFARCLSISPGDPMASAARINAQLGGALFLSAAVNLVALLEQHPELAAVRYTGETMPSPKRLADIAIVLRERIERGQTQTATVPQDAAFLMAYVGYQLKDAALLREGFNALSRTEAASGPHAHIHALIKGVWKIN
jgi:hypothetical protein